MLSTSIGFYFEEDDDESMKSFIEERNIEFLVHFTKCTNLESIFKIGLQPRQYLENHQIESSYNDSFRLDGYLNATCLSISFPNYKMFYSLRCENRDIDWAVLGIYPHVLYSKNCLFFKENAASNNERNTPNYLKEGLTGLSRMFEEYAPPRTRLFMNLDSNLPTNPQAEVLVFDEIKVDDFFGIAFNNKWTADVYKTIIPERIEVIVNESLFNGRHDYPFWRS